MRFVFAVKFLLGRTNLRAVVKGPQNGLGKRTGGPGKLTPQRVSIRNPHCLENSKLRIMLLPGLSNDA